MITKLLRKTSRWLLPFLLVGTLLTQAGAAYMCETPPVTQNFIRDMDRRIEIIEGLLNGEQCGRSAKVTLFGLDFYNDPADANGNQNNVSGQIFSTGQRYLTQSLAVSFNEGLGLKEFFLGVGGTQDSYQLQLDVKEAQKRLEQLQYLMGMTQQACAQSIMIDGMKLSQYTEIWYFTYRHMYFWLMLSAGPTIDESYQLPADTLADKTAIVSTLQSLYLQMAAVRQDPAAQGKWYPEMLNCSYSPRPILNGQTDANLPQNFFTCNPFYTREYASGLLAQCQSPDLNMRGLDSQVDSLERALGNFGASFAEIGEEAANLGGATSKRWEDLQKVFTEGEFQSFVKVRTNLDKAGKALATNLQEFLMPAEAASQAQGFVTKTSSPQTSTGKTPQTVGLQSGQAGGTLGGILGQAFSNEAAVLKAREDAQAAMSMQLRDMLDIKQQALKDIQTINVSLTNSLASSKVAAENICNLSGRHMPSASGEECDK